MDAHPNHSRDTGRELIRKGLFWLFLAQFTLCCARLWVPLPPGEAIWAERLLVALALAAVFGGLTRELPAQNVLFAAAVSGFIWTAGTLIVAEAGLLHGASKSAQPSVPHLLGLASWVLPLRGALEMLSSRGLARFVLFARRR